MLLGDRCHLDISCQFFWLLCLSNCCLSAYLDVLPILFLFSKNRSGVEWSRWNFAVGLNRKTNDLKSVNTMTNNYLGTPYLGKYVLYDFFSSFPWCSSDQQLAEKLCLNTNARKVLRETSNIQIPGVIGTYIFLTISTNCQSDRYWA